LRILMSNAGSEIALLESSGNVHLHTMRRVHESAQHVCKRT
jgi:hypothetical protein